MKKAILMFLLIVVFVGCTEKNKDNNEVKEFLDGLDIIMNKMETSAIRSFDRKINYSSLPKSFKLNNVIYRISYEKALIVLNKFPNNSSLCNKQIDMIGNDGEFITGTKSIKTICKNNKMYISFKKIGQ